MQFVANRQRFLEAVSRVVGAVDKRSTMPSLSHVLITVYMRGALGITATDLEIFAVAECEAGVPGGGGKVCVPAEKIKGVLDAIGAEEITATVHENELIIEADGFRFALSCLPVEEYPAVPEHTEIPLVSFAPGELPRIIRACGHAMGTDQITKAHLCGIHLLHESGRITAVASDGHRISIAGRSHPQAQVFDKGLTLPSKACRLIASTMAGLEYSRQDDSLVHFDSLCSRISSRLIDGEFPNFRRVIPQDSPGSITVDRQRLAEALAACGVVGDDKGKSVTMEGDGEVLTVTALGPQGTATGHVPCIGGEGFKIRVPSRQLLQALKALEGEEVFIKYKDETTPLLLVPIDHGPWDERLELIAALKVG